MAKKAASGIRFVNDQSDVVIRPTGATSSPMPTAPSKPPAISKSGSGIYAPETPITGNPEQSGDITSNPYNQDLDQLVGGASPQPAAGDVRRPVNDGSAPLQPRPDIA